MLINDQITARDVRLVNQFGVVTPMCLEDALDLADSQDLDLVQMSNEEIPVVKIFDYKKDQYNKKKKEKTKAMPAVLKEIQFRTDTQMHDLTIKANQAIAFLGKGYSVKISMRVSSSTRNADAVAYCDDCFEKFLTMIGKYSTVQTVQKTMKNYSLTIKG